MKNSAKIANILFLISVSVSLLANVFVSLITIKGIEINLVVDLAVSQMIIIVPGLLTYIYLNKEGEHEKMYKPIRPITVLLLFIFTWLLMPLVTAANAFSQLFTTNEVLSISEKVLELPIWLMILIIGILGPFSEEFVFRGLIYRNLRGKGSRYIAAATVSALFFGLMHMNLNQFCYAFVLGLVFALINEILDSTWPSFICHAIVNTQNVLMMYISDKILSASSGMGLSDYYSDSTGGVGESPLMKGVLLVMFLVLILVSIVTTALAGLLLYGICALEGKEDRFKMIFSKKESKDNKDNLKVLYPTGYIAIGICVFVMFMLEPLVKLLK